MDVGHDVYGAGRGAILSRKVSQGIGVMSSVKSDSNVTQDMIDAYERDGCVHIPGVFAGYWQERLLDATRNIIERHRQTKGAQPKASANGQVEGVIVMERHPGRIGFRQAVDYDPVFQAWVRESNALDVVADVIGASSLRYLMDTTFCKEKSDSDTATPVHHDIAVYCFKGSQVPSLWVALTDIGEDDAPLQTVLGSHKWQDVMYRPPTDSSAQPLIPGYLELSEIPARIEREGATWKTWPCKAGDALVIHPYTLHASLPKESAGGMRIGFSSRWMGEDVTWSPNAFSPIDHIKSRDQLKPGDAPPDDQFPVVWRREGGS